MNEIDFNEHAREVLGNLRKGAFLTTSADGKINTMTIGWGNIGIMWTKPAFTVMVRKSRFTHSLLEKSGEFTVSVPAEDMSTATAYCGTKSGKDVDKFAECGLKTLPGQKINTPVIQCKGTHFECKVLYKHTITADSLAADIKSRLYADNDYHTMYFGAILSCYTI
jgi:flavin reductase (DIM6/NTAB) family NADH-FMN oxidoreductase RutF